MARTHAAERIGVRKDMVRTKIIEAKKLVASAMGRVPDPVLNGSHQIAVARKEAAHKAAAFAERGVPKRASVSRLEHLLQQHHDVAEAIRTGNIEYRK